MDAERLKSLQAPLKEKYNADPTSALITLRAEGRATEGVACKVETGRAIVTAGLHPATAATALWRAREIWYLWDLGHARSAAQL